MVEPVAKAGTVATIAGKLTPDFEAIISELNQAIQSKPIISNSNSIHKEQLMDKSDFYSGLADIEVMDEDLTLCKCVSSGKEMVPCHALCLQGDGCDFNAGKGSGVEGTNLVRGRPKRSGFKIKVGRTLYKAHLQVVQMVLYPKSPLQRLVIQVVLNWMG